MTIPNHSHHKPFRGLLLSILTHTHTYAAPHTHMLTALRRRPKAPYFLLPLTTGVLGGGCALVAPFALIPAFEQEVLQLPPHCRMRSDMIRQLRICAPLSSSWLFVHLVFLLSFCCVYGFVGRV